MIRRSSGAASLAARRARRAGREVLVGAGMPRSWHGASARVKQGASSFGGAVPSQRSCLPRWGHQGSRARIFFLRRVFQSLETPVSRVSRVWKYYMIVDLSEKT
jgi:hypothetical protein